MELFIVIICMYDGDSYSFHTKIQDAREIYDAQEINDVMHKVCLLKVKEGVDFGFNGNGEIYGCEVIEEKSDDCS